MSQVVGLDGAPIAHDPVLREREVALVGLRDLLAQMESGTTPATGWVLTYSVDKGDGNESIRLLSADLTLASVLWLLENGKHKLLRESGAPI